MIRDAWNVIRRTANRGPRFVRRFFIIAAVLLAAPGCGKKDSAENYPFLIPIEASWDVARETVAKVKEAMEEGDLEGFRGLLALRTREAFPLETLQADYAAHREEYVNRVRTAKIMHVVRPVLESPWVDIKLLYFDNTVEWWRLAYEDGHWRIQKTGLTILDLEYNSPAAPPPRR